MGRPSSFKPEYTDQATKLAMLGATNEDLAAFFNVSVSTVGKWIAENGEFSDALKEGRAVADSRVARSLYERATGYQHRAVKIFADPKTGAQKIIEYTERYPPDTTACIFWLKNRRPDLWRDRVQAEMTGKDGGPIQTEDVSGTDLARRIAYALANPEANE